MHLPENWIAFIIAVVLPMVVGSLWYGPLFGKKWMAMMNLTEQQIRETLNPAKSYGGSFIGSILTAYVLSFLITLMDMGSLTGGLTIGLIAWLGFVLPTGWQTVAWEDKKDGVFLLNQIYNLIVYLLMAGLIGAWH